MSTSLGAQAMWRQLVDLAGQGRVPITEGVLYRLRALRAIVPQAVREASARALASAAPPAPIVALFAEDTHAVSAPVLREARLSAVAWIALLPFLAPAGRAVLRHRRDLPAEVTQALGAYGRVDFVLSSARESGVIDNGPGVPGGLVVAPVASLDPAPPSVETVPAGAEPAGAEPAGAEFVSVASVAMGLPVVAAALRQARAAEEAAPAKPVERSDAPGGPFEIADIVARIDAFQRQRDETGPAGVDDQPVQPERLTFRFETDMAGAIRWVSGIAREGVIGVLIGDAGGAGARPGAVHVDGVASGAFRRRARFSNARLTLAGGAGVAGQWRISALPVFDTASGRFMGYRGHGRRPRADEHAEPAARPAPLAVDSLRQLVHELRTPTTAIVGFAEMIDAQLLGPVPGTYRGFAGAICVQSRALLGAIDDLDTATRIEAGALDLRPGTVMIAPMLRRVASGLAALVLLRGSALDVVVEGDGLAVRADDWAVERLLSRLMAALAASTAPGEHFVVRVSQASPVALDIRLDRPAALAGLSLAELYAIDADADADDHATGAPLLGTGFALRLSNNLATELGGSLSFETEHLTLRLPAAFTDAVDQASTN
ncbi:MAG: sensor histidine kinase [Sphingomonas sp.]